MKKVSWSRFNRKIHYWGASLCALPILLVILTGILLLLKKESAWIQPSTMKGSGTEPSIPYAQVLERVSEVPEAEVAVWEDIDRLDVRPGKGVIKVQAKNRWEVQLDHQTGEVLSVAYRRSDLIESLHDGSFFHDAVKLWIFLPSALILLLLWLTGLYLFAQPFLRRRGARSASR